MPDIPDTLTRIRHAYLADPGSPRIVDAMPHLEAALCALLSREPSKPEDVRQCPRCGDTAPPTVDIIDGKCRLRCGAGCGHFTGWEQCIDDVREEFY